VLAPHDNAARPKAKAAASAAMVSVTKQIEPNGALRDTYDFYYDKYVRTYPQMKELLHQVADKVGESE
jgi:hypothetical protein